MVSVAVAKGMGYYLPINGDNWSPDVPGLDALERQRRMDDFEADCFRRGVRNWRALARELGHDIQD